MVKMVLNILNVLIKYKSIVFKAVSGLAVASLIFCSAMLYKNNKKLSESLKMAQNNIEAYQNIANGYNEQNNMLMLTVDQLNNSNDSLLNVIKNNAKTNNIKIKEVNTVATQTQTIHVNDSKGVKGDLVDILNSDSIYSDSIKYNDLTSIYFNIDKDSINIALDIKNTQYLYTFKHKQYKNNKNFFQRLFTLDFKKEYKYEYKIYNTNSLIDTNDVRVVEIVE